VFSAFRVVGYAVLPTVFPVFQVCRLYRSNCQSAEHQCQRFFRLAAYALRSAVLAVFLFCCLFCPTYQCCWHFELVAYTVLFHLPVFQFLPLPFHLPSVVSFSSSLHVLFYLPAYRFFRRAAFIILPTNVTVFWIYCLFYHYTLHMISVCCVTNV